VRIAQNGERDTAVKMQVAKTYIELETDAGLESMKVAHHTGRDSEV
jgi:hypothetical protein